MTTKSLAATLQSTLRAPVVHGHGGRRVGSGRKKTGNLSVMVRLNEAQKELFDNIGGSAFLQAILDSISKQATGQYEYTLSLESILASCVSTATADQLKTLVSKLSQPIYVLDENQKIHDCTVLEVLNDFSEKANTPRGELPKFFYKNGALCQWQGGREKVVERTTAVEGYLKLIQFAITDLDNNGSVSWAWDRKELEELVEEM